MSAMAGERRGLRDEKDKTFFQKVSKKFSIFFILFAHSFF